MRRLVAGLALVLALGGCTQIDALAPVGGAGIADVRYAANEVLLEKDVDILVAPVCSGEGLELRCTGETVNGETITATSTSEDESTFELIVDAVTLYSGDVQTVLDRNGTVGAS